MVGFWFLKAELSLLKFFAQNFVCDIGGRRQGPVSSIDHFSRVIQVYWQNICWDLRRQKGAFVSIVDEKFFDLPALPSFPPSLSYRKNARKCWTILSCPWYPTRFLLIQKMTENAPKCSWNEPIKSIFCVRCWGKTLWSLCSLPRSHWGILSIWSRPLLTEWTGRDQTYVPVWFGQ